MVLILTSFVYVISFFNLIEWSSFVHFIMFTFLIITLFTDMEHQIIPNELSFGLLLIAILYSYTGLFLKVFKGYFWLWGFLLLLLSLRAYLVSPSRLVLGILNYVWGWVCYGDGK